MQNTGEQASAATNRQNELRVELARKVALSVGAAESRVTEVPGLTLYRHATPTAPSSALYEPSVALVVQGRKEVELGSTTFSYDPLKYLLTSLDLPVVSRVVEASAASPYLCMRLKLEMSMIREILNREEFEQTAIGPDGPAMTTAAVSLELLRAFDRLIDLLNAPEDISFISPLLQREIIYRILRSAEGQRLRAVATAGDQSYRTAKVIAWIKANYKQTLRIENLAHIAGMSMSTLHHHFRMSTSMSPLQYQKQLRLQAARQRMLMDGVDATTAAYEVGYESVTQFSREYSRSFGQPPIRDIKTLRDGKVGAIHVA